MGKPEASNYYSSNLNSEELQLRLYQVFIFSIPVLFSVILFLLFYLFYLKKRAFDLSSPPQPPLNSNQAASSFPPPAGMKGDLQEKLVVVSFDEELKAKDSQCCVCLGEFEVKEELLQVPHCGHVFHSDCIRSWLRKNATCPLCRCQVSASEPRQPPRQESSGVANSSRSGSDVASIHVDEHVLHVQRLIVDIAGPIS